MALTSISFPVYPKPDVLFHYTTSDACGLIIARRKLWLSDIARMNDAKERLWVTELSERVWHKRLSAGHGTNEAGHYFGDFKLDKSPVFIACFSENGDLLSQWRAYTGD